jgi:glycosyltransferase involved in cell wall biosynthesis
VVISSIRTEEMERTYHLLLERFSSPLVSQYVAVSDHTKHFTIRRSKTKPEKIVTIYNGVDAHEYGHNPRTSPSLIKSSLGINLKSKVVGTVGRLRKEKGHGYLLQAFAHIARTMKDVTLLIVGEGEDSVRLKRLTDELGLKDHVIFSGLRDDVPDLLRVMDVFVLSSLWEGMPNALLEAMAAKKPVIATSVGGVPEVIVDGKTGLLVPPNDTQALSMALMSLLADENRRRGFGEAGYQRVVEHFSLAQTLARTERLYHEMMVAKKG